MHFIDCYRPVNVFSSRLVSVVQLRACMHEWKCTRFIHLSIPVACNVTILQFEYVSSLMHFWLMIRKGVYPSIFYRFDTSESTPIYRDMHRNDAASCKIWKDKWISFQMEKLQAASKHLSNIFTSFSRHSHGWTGNRAVPSISFACISLSSVE